MTPTQQLAQRTASAERAYWTLVRSPDAPLHKIEAVTTDTGRTIEDFSADQAAIQRYVDAASAMPQAQKDIQTVPQIVAEIDAVSIEYQTLVDEFESRLDQLHCRRERIEATHAAADRELQAATYAMPRSPEFEAEMETLSRDIQRAREEGSRAYGRKQIAAAALAELQRELRSRKQRPGDDEALANAQEAVDAAQVEQDEATTQIETLQTKQTSAVADYADSFLKPKD